MFLKTIKLHEKRTSLHYLYYLVLQLFLSCFVSLYKCLFLILFLITWIHFHLFMMLPRLCVFILISHHRNHLFSAGIHSIFCFPESFAERETTPTLGTEGRILQHETLEERRQYFRKAKWPRTDGLLRSIEGERC